MSKETYIRAILESNFAGFKEEIIETAVKKIMEYDDPVKHGKWIEEPGMFMCSVCGDAWGEENEDWVMSFRYCPNCGAKIDDDTAPSEEAYDDFYAKHRD